ncbi:hypothetical protein IC617_08785 [Neiella sp. HB171785]|uniref:Uncharacterized protein n=1 Tax=Neiella litorisoli TaxID=2771431 RepID=A0A8J6UPU7_9GAMM|nr:hypothetical protein [Neiella litorisoli]MBD1389522.1 hypothetical protein [Neiella litorisoli]
MANDVSVHNHASERLETRFGVDTDWLTGMLEQGRFVWLKGTGHSFDAKSVRSGHLIFIPEKHEYCVAVMDDRKRLAITVLTEKMALNSSWGEGLNHKTKLRAKRLALDEETVPDIHFLLMQAQDNQELAVTVQARTVSYDWKPVVRNLYKTRITPEQLDVDSKCCTLTSEQMNAVSKAIHDRLESQAMRPYCELLVRSAKGKKALISNTLDSVSDLQNATIAMRWEQQLDTHS